MTASRPDPAAVRTVTCAGTGVIGGGWVAYFLARGYDVVAWDPAPGAEERLRHLVDAAWPALTELGLREGASRDRLSYEPDLATAVADTDFVQESAPEDLELKRTLLADIDAATPPGVVISSSTSGYGMTEMQDRCAHPERTVVGHPFNPPYLIPLVEVVGGTRTSADVVAWTSDFFRHAGKSVITMDREVTRLRDSLGTKFAESVYYGFWFAPEFEILKSMIDQTQETVSGDVDAENGGYREVTAGTVSGDTYGGFIAATCIAMPRASSSLPPSISTSTPMRPPCT